MKFNYFLITLRAVILVVVAAFIAGKARDYLINSLGWPVTPGVYAFGVFAFISIVLWLSTKNLFSRLRANAQALQPGGTVNLQNTHKSYHQTMHKYPHRIGYLVIAIGIIFVAVPYLSVEPGKTIAPVTYVGCFGMAFIMFMIVFYIFRYSVTIKSDRIIVKTFGIREIKFSDIMKTDTIATKNGPQAIVSLKDGKVLKLGGMLTDFAGILESLAAQHPDPRN